MAWLPFQISDAVKKAAGNAVVSYPYEDAASPRVQRYVTRLRSESLPAYLSQDKEYNGTGGLANCLLVHLEDMGGDNQARNYFMVFEPLPGPWIPHTRFDDNLGPVQGRRRAVQALSTHAATRTATTSTTHEARDQSTVVNWEIQESWSNGTGSTGNPAYPINDRDYYDERLGAVQERTQMVVKTGSEEGTLVNNAGVITETTFEPDANSALLKRVVKTYAVTGPSRAGQQTGTWGVETVTSQTVTAGTAATNTAQTKDGKIQALNAVHSEAATVLLPAASENIFGTLLDQDHDAATGIITDIEKSLVVAAQAATLATAKRTAGWFTELQGQTVGRQTLMISSKVRTDSLPADEEFRDHESVSLPDKLIKVEIRWNKNMGAGGGVTLYLDEDEVGTGGSVNVSASASISGALDIRVQNGFSGKTRADVVRKFLTSVPTSFLPYNIEPSIGTVTIFERSTKVGYNKNEQLRTQGIGGDASVSSGSRTASIGPVLSNSIALTGTTPDTAQSLSPAASNAFVAALSGDATATAEGTAVLHMPASSPTVIASGALVSRFQRVSKWRLGIWVVEQVSVYAP